MELGWFLGAAKPAFGHSNSATPLAARNAAFLRANPDPIPRLAVGSFGLSDNRMIAGALEAAGGLPMAPPQDGHDRPFDPPEVFEGCVAQAAARLSTG